MAKMLKFSSEKDFLEKKIKKFLTLCQQLYKFFARILELFILCRLPYYMQYNIILHPIPNKYCTVYCTNNTTYTRTHDTPTLFST